MRSRLLGLAVFGGLLLSVPACERVKPADGSIGAATSKQTDKVIATVGDTLFTTPYDGTQPTAPNQGPKRSSDPIVVADCRLSVIQKQDVPSERDGKLFFIGTVVKDGESVPDDQIFYVPLRGHALPQDANQVPALVSLASGLVSAEIWPPSSALPLRLTSHLSSSMLTGTGTGNLREVERFRKLKEGDRVDAGQLLGRLDTTLAREEVAIKRGKVLQAASEFAAAEKTRDETRARYLNSQKLSKKGNMTVSDEDISERRLAYDRYYQEAITKQIAIDVAKAELNQAQAVMDKHDIRSQIPGIIKTIHKKPGEAVKNLDPVVEVDNLDKLRVEGLLEVQYLPRLRKGMRVVVEASEAESPQLTLVGHLGDITGVAVGVNKANETIIASASEDGTIRVWNRTARRPLRLLRQLADGRSVAVRSLAATPPGAPLPLLLTGGTDGSARLWDVDAESSEPLFELKGQHHGTITCVAFSPDGKFCAIGGDDREISLWDTATGKFQYKFPLLHKSGLTSLKFTVNSQLVSAARDNTIRLWKLGNLGASSEKYLDRRAGEVQQFDVSNDGSHVLFDQGKTLRVMTVPDLITDGVLQNPSGAANFTTFAIFSPDGQLILTAGASEGRLQLWRAPSATSRGYELRQLVSIDRTPASCGAFDPKGEFMVTGTRNGLVHIWPMPSKTEIEQERTAEVTLIEQSVEGAGRQVRLWAEMPNADGKLLPGNTVTMSIYPK